MPPRLLVLAALFPLLAACGGKSAGKVASTVDRPAPGSPAKPVRTAVRAPAPAKPALVRPQVVPGLEGVIGASEAELTRQFGAARLEVWEGDARKLQYSGTPCVLDIYLYPAAQGREPLASHVEARRVSDGEEVDRIACVAALRRR
jgi:hypothetical protein